MKKRLFLACAAVMALAAPLAACDDDQPQTPQKESAIAPETLEGVVAPAAGEAVETVLPETSAVIVPEADTANTIAPDVTNPTADPAAVNDGAVEPADIAEENIPPPPSREEFTDESCAYDAWIGTKLDEELVKAEGRPYRLVKPGDAMTMDHNPDRINVEHSDGTVMRVWCG